MAKGRGGRGGTPRSRGESASRRGGRSGATPAPRTTARRATPRGTPSPIPEPEAPSTPFRLGAVIGATPGRWIDRWQERRARPLELVPIAVAEQRDALLAGDVDAALVRLPIDREDLHVIVLYDEVAVVVVSADSHLAAADELEPADLAGEVVITPADDVLGMPLPDGAVAPAFPAPATTGDAIETAATGVGVVIVPMSLARLHHRRDVTYRPLRAAPISSVALAWVADRTTPDVEAFVGIVRGRTANSSR